MLKKIVVIGISVLTMVLTIGSTVEAGTGTVSGTSVSQCVCFSCTGAVISCSKATVCFKQCSIGVASILSGLGNVTKGPNATPAAYNVNLFVQDAEVSCVNKAGNAQSGEGQPFIDQSGVPAEESDTIDDAQVTKNGRALSDILFEDEQLLQALIDGGAFEGTGITSIADLCPNNNWTARVLVNQLQAFGRLFYDEDGQGGCNLDDPSTFPMCTLADALSVQCSAPADATVDQPFTYVGGDGSPPCDTLCHNSDNNVVDCPVDPAVIAFP